jgi:hypothetical protein
VDRPSSAARRCRPDARMCLRVTGAPHTGPFAPGALGGGRAGPADWPRQMPHATTRATIR